MFHPYMEWNILSPLKEGRWTSHWSEQSQALKVTFKNSSLLVQIQGLFMTPFVWTPVQTLYTLSIVVICIHFNLVSRQGVWVSSCLFSFSMKPCTDRTYLDERWPRKRPWTCPEMSSCLIVLTLKCLDYHSTSVCAHHTWWVASHYAFWFRDLACTEQQSSAEEGNQVI